MKQLSIADSAVLWSSFLCLTGFAGVVPLTGQFEVRPIVGATDNSWMLTDDQGGELAKLYPKTRLLPLGDGTQLILSPRDDTFAADAATFDVVDELLPAWAQSTVTKMGGVPAGYAGVQVDRSLEFWGGRGGGPTFGNPPGLTLAGTYSPPKAEKIVRLSSRMSDPIVVAASASGSSSQYWPAPASIHTVRPIQPETGEGFPVQAMATSQGRLRLLWNATAGAAYGLISSPTPEGPYQIVETVLAETSGVLAVEVAFAEHAAFFRVQLRTPNNSDANQSNK